MTRLTPKLHSLTTLVSPTSSIEEYIYMYMVNMAYMVKSGQLRANMPKIRVHVHPNIGK